MFNCVIVKINGRTVAVFSDIDKAEMYRKLYVAQFGNLHPEIFCDWAYIEGLPF